MANQHYTEIKVGDLVRGIRGERYKVIQLISIFGIPSADLEKVKKDGMPDNRSFKIHNRPLSCLEKEVTG